MAERIERGDLSARVPVASRDEFGTWAERFNQMTAALSDTIRRLEAAQHQNRRFVADVSHELRTPLTALVAEASIVGAHLDGLPPKSRRAAELLVADVGRLRNLVEELMELSRFDADAEEVALERVDLVRLTQTVRRGPAAGGPVRTAEPSVAPTRTSDGSNGSSATCSTMPANMPAHRGRGRARRPGRRVVVAVSDVVRACPRTGSSGSSSGSPRWTHRVGGSSGLGLAIAAEHAALLGGYLQAMNREGGGLRLEFVMPQDVAGSLRAGDGGDGEREAGSDTAQGDPPIMAQPSPFLVPALAGLLLVTAACTSSGGLGPVPSVPPTAAPSVDPGRPTRPLDPAVAVRLAVGHPDALVDPAIDPAERPTLAGNAGRDDGRPRLLRPRRRRGVEGFVPTLRAVPKSAGVARAAMEALLDARSIIDAYSRLSTRSRSGPSCWAVDQGWRGDGRPVERVRIGRRQRLRDLSPRAGGPTP